MYAVRSVGLPGPAAFNIDVFPIALLRAGCKRVRPGHSFLQSPLLSNFSGKLMRISCRYRPFAQTSMTRYATCSGIVLAEFRRPANRQHVAIVLIPGFALRLRICRRRDKGNIVIAAVLRYPSQWFINRGHFYSPAFIGLRGVLSDGLCRAAAIGWASESWGTRNSSAARRDAPTSSVISRRTRKKRDWLNRV